MSQLLMEELELFKAIESLEQHGSKATPGGLKSRKKEDLKTTKKL